MTSTPAHDTYERHVRPYAVIPAELIRDRALSADARWLQTVLLDRPPGWRPNSRDLAARSGMSRARVLRARRELIAAGWLVEERRRHDDGTLRTTTLILDRPIPPSDRQAVKVDRLTAAYRRQAGDQLELDVLGAPEPVDDTVDNADDRSTPVGPRSDQGKDDVPAGHTGDPLTGPGQRDPLVSTDRQVSRAPAREPESDAMPDPDGQPDPDAPTCAKELAEVHPWLRNRTSTPTRPSRPTSSSESGDSDATPDYPSGDATRQESTTTDHATGPSRASRSTNAAA